MNDLLRTEAQGIVLEALATLKDVTGGEAIDVSPATRLYGQGTMLDSLGLVQLLIDVEERVNDRYGVSIALTDDRAMSQEHSPFRTVTTLAEYVAGLVDGQTRNG